MQVGIKRDPFYKDVMVIALVVITDWKGQQLICGCSTNHLTLRLFVQFAAYLVLLSLENNFVAMTEFVD